MGHELELARRQADTEQQWPVKQEQHVQRPKGESVRTSGQIGRSYKYSTMARLLLFTTSKGQYEDDHDNALLMLTVIADAGKVKIKEKNFKIE